MVEYTCATCGDPVADIVEIVSHDCPRVLRAEDLTRREQDTLLYVENCVVDNHGELGAEKMNYDDQQNMKLFRVDGLLETEQETDYRVASFSDAAWDLARDCRQMRAARDCGEVVDVGTPAPERTGRWWEHIDD